VTPRGGWRFPTCIIKSMTHTHWLVVELADKDKDEVN